MLTNADPFTVFIVLAVATLMVAYSYDRAKERREAERLRSEALRSAIARGGHGEFPDHELLAQIWLDLPGLLTEIAVLTNRAAKAARVKGFPIARSVRRLAEQTIASILKLAAKQSDDQFLLTTALMVAVLTKQAANLRRRKGYLCVTAVCARMVDLTNEVIIGTRVVEVDSGSDLVAAICEAFTYLGNQVAALQKNSESRAARRL